MINLTAHSNDQKLTTAFFNSPLLVYPRLTVFELYCLVFKQKIDLSTVTNHLEQALKKETFCL